MGCFGKCGCAECCMDVEELSLIAVSIVVDGPGVDDYTEGFVEGDCCHYATIPVDVPWSTYCEKVADQTITEIATVSNKILEHQKYTSASPWQAVVGPEGFCAFTSQSAPNAADIADACDTILNCGTTVETFQDKTELYFAVTYRYTEINVAIYKRLMTCPPSIELECKYVVECTIRYEAQIGGGRYDSYTRTYVHSNKHECCVEICDDGKPDHDPAFDCETDADFGNVVEYTMTAVKIYDSIDDIPSVITFDEPYESTACTFEFCIGSNDGPEQFVATNTDLPCPAGGQLDTFSVEASCFYCYDTGLSCEDDQLHANESQVCRLPDGGFGCDCELGERFDGRNLSHNGITPPQSFSYDVLKVLEDYTYQVSGEGCHIFPDQPYCSTCPECPPEEGCYPGVIIEERTACNWWDCGDCHFTGYDPIMLPYSNWFTNVDAYSFTCVENQYSDEKQFIIPFPQVTITLVT